MALRLVAYDTVERLAMGGSLAPWQIISSAAVSIGSPCLPPFLPGPSAFALDGPPRTPAHAGAHRLRHTSTSDTVAPQSCAPSPPRLTACHSVLAHVVKPPPAHSWRDDRTAPPSARPALLGSPLCVPAGGRSCLRCRDDSDTGLANSRSFSRVGTDSCLCRSRSGWS